MEIENRRRKCSDKLDKIGVYVISVAFDPLKTSLSEIQAEAEKAIKIVELRHCDWSPRLATNLVWRRGHKRKRHSTSETVGVIFTRL